AKRCNAARPKRPSVGTRSRKAMSSSMAMGAALRHQFVTARFGDQDRRAGAFLLDLLPQPIDVRLQRVGGDAGIIAPHLLQERLARDRTLARAVARFTDALC